MAKKTYKQKYKSKREDFRKGGRVKAARGFTGEPQEIKPIQQTKKKPIKKPIQPAPKKPVQPGIPVTPVTGTGNLKTGTPATPRDLPPGTTGSPTLPGVKIDPALPSKGRGRGRPISIGSIGGGTGTIRPTPPKTGGPVELPIDLPEISEEERIKFLQERGFTPEEIAEMKERAGGSSQRPVGRPVGKGRPGERPRFIAREDQDSRKGGGFFAQALNKSKEGREIPDRPYQEKTTRGGGIGRLFRTVVDKTKAKAEQAKAEQAAQAQSAQARQASTAQRFTTPMSQADFFKQYGKFEGNVRQKNAYKNWQNQRQKAYEDYINSFSTQSNTPSKDTTETTTNETTSETTTKPSAEEQVSARQSAEAAARGEVPEAAKVSDAVQVGYERDAQGQLLLDEEGNPIPLREQQVITMDPVTKARTDIRAEGQDAEAVATSQAAQADTTIGQFQRDAEGNLITDKEGNPIPIKAAGFTADTVADKDVEVKAATGTVSQGPIEDIQGTITGDVRFATVDELQIEAGQAERVDDVLGPDNDYLVKEVEGDDPTVAATPDAERSERETILGEPAPPGVAAAINDTVGYTAAKQRPVKGKAAQGAAADMIAQTADLPPDIAAAVVQDPATVEAQIDTQPVEVQAAVAALPQEALVSSQMETLLGGMEDGEIPMWARPAVDAVNAGLARRGLSVSTVGRDSLFNAIIQSALPMAQSNAQALQQRAAQNLSNEQQANLQQATQQQQLRLQNLSNRQTAASQTAQMSQQMRVMQSQFDQQAVMTTAEQQQQTRLANLQNEQQAALVRSQNQQQANMQNLGNEQQLNMTELQIDAARAGADQSAENQEKIAEMQIAADFLAKNAGFKQQMELANLTNDQQMRLANLSSRNQAASETLSNAEKIELANLNKTMQTNQLQAQLANQMGIAQLNVDQQTAIQNATTKANMDMAKFSSAQQIELANSKFMQTVALTDMNAEQQAIMQNATAMASMDLANLNTRERLAVQNAQNFLAMDMANMNNEQQANMMKAQQEQQRLLSDQAATNAAKQFNAASENQTNQFMASLAAQIEQSNVAQTNAMRQFNDSQTNAAAARDANRAADVEKFNTQLETQIDQFNANQDFARNQWNAQNQAVVEQSNTQWRRNMNTANTAMQNQINAQNAQNAFAMSQTAQSFLWQELRDQADYDFRNGENEKNRIAQLVNTALASDPKKYGGSVASIEALIGAITGDVFGG